MDVNPELLTLEANLIHIKLCNQQSLFSFIDPCKLQQKPIHKLVPITIIINSSAEPIQDDHEDAFNFSNVK